MILETNWLVYIIRKVQKVIQLSSALKAIAAKLQFTEKEKHAPAGQERSKTGRGSRKVDAV